MRIDRYLWFVRLVKTRSAAQGIAAARHLRIDGRVIDKAAACVRIGDTLTFPLNGRVRVIRVAALPERRGPAVEAQACYLDITPENVSQHDRDH